MKRAGKRDRLRKSARLEAAAPPAAPPTPTSGAASATPASGPEAPPAPEGRQAAPLAPRPPAAAGAPAAPDALRRGSGRGDAVEGGAAPGRQPARLAERALVWAFVLGLTALVWGGTFLLSRRAPTAPASPASAAERPPQASPPAPAQPSYVPMTPIDTPPARRAAKTLTRARPEDLTRRSVVPGPSPAEAGDPRALWRQALGALPAVAAPVRQELERAARDPGAPLGEDAQRALRALEPALGLLRRTAAATAALGSAAALPLGQDLGAARLLATAALARAQREARGEAPALAAEWALAVAALGQALARQGPGLEAGAGLALARLAWEGLDASLERDRWSASERAWLRARLLELRAGRPSAPTPPDAPTPAPQAPPDAAPAAPAGLPDLRAGLARAAAQERAALERLLTRCEGAAPSNPERKDVK